MQVWPVGISSVQFRICFRHLPKYNNSYDENVFEQMILNIIQNLSV